MEKMIVSISELKREEGKISCARFKTMHENLCLKLACEEEAKYTLVAFNSKGEREEIYSAELAGEGRFFGEYRFDPISLAVYHDSQEFTVEITPATARVLEFSVCEEYEDGVAEAEKTPDVTIIREDGSRGIFVNALTGCESLFPQCRRRV